jgi:protein SCO1
MSQRLMTSVIAIAVVIIVFAGIGYLVVRQAEKSRIEIPILGDVAPYAFVDHEGSPFTRDSTAGQLTVYSFFFTGCMGVCPVMNSRLSSLYTSFQGSSKVRIVSISVDPDADSIPAIAEYASMNGVIDRNWLFVRGDIAEVRQLCEKSFLLAADGFPSNHPVKFILADDQARIRGFYEGTDEESGRYLKGHIRELARTLK